RPAASASASCVSPAARRWRRRAAAKAGEPPGWRSATWHLPGGAARAPPRGASIPPPRRALPPARRPRAEARRAWVLWLKPWAEPWVFRLVRAGQPRHAGPGRREVRAEQREESDWVGFWQAARRPPALFGLPRGLPAAGGAACPGACLRG